MAITHTICNSFKKELLEGIHDFTADTIKMALFDSNATLGASTTAYSTTSEVTGTGYTAGGVTVTAVAPGLSGSTAILDFNDAVFSGVTITPYAALLYNSSKGNRAICVINFGGVQNVSAGTFTYQFPEPTSAQAMIKIS